MTIGTRLYTLFFGQFVGMDAFGNRYFQHRDTPKTGRRKRWVLYRGLTEASKIPAEWHGWLHYAVETPPSIRPVYHYTWEKPHQPNLTGTKGAYVPPGHLLHGGERARTEADYQPWRPS